MGAFTQIASDEFNYEVADTLTRRGFLVRTQVSKIGKERISDGSGNTLGDVDVLCLDVPNRRLFALECKDFSMARMPNEVSNDMDALFISSKEKRCAQDKHVARVEWLKGHLSIVVTSVCGDVKEAHWSVEGAFVFSVPLISPLLLKSRLPVWTLQDLRDGRGP